MNQYTVISDVSDYICRLLKDNMTPEPILNKDSVGLCTPSDKGDLSLGIFLYDIKKSKEVVRCNTMINMGMKVQKYPPEIVNLYYMITAYSNTELRSKYFDEQKILGKAIQVLVDNPIIRMDNIASLPEAIMSEAKIQLLDLNFEDKFKIWNGQNIPYKLSLCFKVYPIEIQSTRIKTTQRVIETISEVEEKK